MRTLQIAAVTAVALAAAFYLHPQPVRAQTGCTVSNLQGTYAYTSSGVYGLPQGLGFFAAAGRLTFNGDGTFTGLDTASSNGQVQRNRATNGTYTLAGDCRGSANYQSPAVATVDFIVSSGGQTVNFVQADAGAVISGTATLQVLPANAQ
jgi:hypothetical protein